MKALLVNSSDEGDRRVLLAERDAARRDRLIVELRADLAKTSAMLLKSEMEAEEYLRQIGRLEAQFAVIYGSVSWRWSSPVRRVMGIMDRLRASLGGPPPAVLPSLPAVEPVEDAPAPLSLREQAILHRLQRAG